VANGDWRDLRLEDRVGRGLRVLFVGINPGVRSAQTGHHFAGYSNRFWKLMFESGLVPEPITYRDDARLIEFGLGITNLIARPRPGIDDLSPGEYVEKKIRRYRPEVVALVGITLFRVLEPLLPDDFSVPGRRRSATKARARIFVLPNPSGRNAHFSYGEMLEAFVSLRRSLSVSRRRPVRAGGASAARAAAATGRSSRGAGIDRRTTPSPPAAAPSRTAPRTRAASPSQGRRRPR